METINADAVLTLCTRKYLASSQFNGVPLRDIASILHITVDAARSVVRDLMADGLLEAVFGVGHPNPHIKAFPAGPVDVQLRKYENDKLRQRACFYPTFAALDRVVERPQYSDRPFTLSLALGEPQLAFLPFDLSVLEIYRNDPRYFYETSDIGGSLSVTDEHYETDTMPSRDQVLLQSFGFCFGSSGERAVAVYLRYLTRLTPEHQQIWRSRLLDGEFGLHPDYWRTTLGDFPQGLSIYEATLAELKFINTLVKVMGRAPLFRNEYEQRPSDFGFLLRPTRRQLAEFVQLLDKMLSDNINVACFSGEVTAEDLERRSDGVTIARPRGTIRMLDEWLGTKFPNEARADIIDTFKRVRKSRSKPAHAVGQDAFDVAIAGEQRDLMAEVHRAVSQLRRVLRTDPTAADVKLPRYLEESVTVWNF